MRLTASNERRVSDDRHWLAAFAALQWATALLIIAAIIWTKGI